MLHPEQPGGQHMDPAGYYGHSRTRTTSSNVFPMHAPNSHHLAQPPPNPQHSRRSPSVNTFSTSSSIPPPAAYRISSSTDLRRSTSSRSGGAASIQPSSYVALLRKQKATVWCDRAQLEDPGLIAKHKAAKMRANLEVVGGRASGSAGNGSRTNTGISGPGKIAGKMKRNHGKAPAVGFAPGDHHVGVGGVPLRLSATEVEAESSDDEDQQASRLHHRRTGSSGRSSTASGRRGIAYRTSGGAASLTGRRWSPGDTPERSGSLMEEQPEELSLARADSGSGGKPRSTASGSSAERADNVGELGNAPRLASNSLLHSALTREKSVKSPEELKRRGSVDERTATLTSGRLFIANPD